MLLLPLIALLLIAAAYGFRKLTPRSPSDLVPILCHREPGIGLLFITIENRGNDAGPSTTTLVFNTAFPSHKSNGASPPMRLAVQTPSIPSGTDAWVAVELPSAPGAGFIQPAGKITITTTSTKKA
ncbi:MAG TPA: hypothetical protein VH593_13165, partial [Ktedonobacteraceae bacterium]